MSEQSPWRAPLQEFLVDCLRTPLGGLVARPWFDRVALKVIADWFFPLSRLWAAARAAEGSVDRYFIEAQIEPSRRLARQLESRLGRFEAVRNTVVATEQVWEDAFFGGGRPTPASLARIEETRLSDRDSYNNLRRIFAPLALGGRVPPILWDIPGPGKVEEIYGELVTDPARAFAAPETMPRIETSRPVDTPRGQSYWLRYDSPSSRMADQVIARVYEPGHVADPPTLIFGHGICVEFDHWRGLVDEVDAMVARGIRVVRPEAPWHGRRVQAGRYGGEPFMATAPAGALDLFTSAAREWSVLIDWCRRSFTTPVGIGGSSLGAMTAQIIADKARHWPERLRPDAMFLVTHCGHIEDAVVHGSLARVWGIAEATMAQGWTPELIRRYMPLLDAESRPVVAPENIVTVLGNRDDVTPFESAETVIGEWGVPAENRFISPRGHFSVPIGMMRDHSSLSRFCAILDRLA